MNEELEQSATTDNTALIQELQDLTKVISEQNELDQQEEEPKTVIVDGEEKTDSDLLVDILQVLSPDEEQEELKALDTTNQLELLNSINENLIEMNTQNELNHIEQIERHIEGSFMVSLTIITAFAVYMFWSQLSKW